MNSICFISSSRADYDLLSPLMKRVNSSADLSFQFVVSGSHFIENQGLTIKRIIEDGFEIHKEIRFSEGATKNKIIRNLSSSIYDYSEALTDLKPDAVVLLGDRYEIFGAAISAFINPRSRFTAAAAPFINPSARKKVLGKGTPLIGKFSTARWV